MKGVIFLEGKEGIVVAEGTEGKVKVWMIGAEAGGACGLGDSCCRAGSRASCDLKQMFAFFAGNSHVTEIEALNATGAQVGQRCLVELKGDKNALVKGSLAAYLIPGLLFLVGLGLGGWLGGLLGWSGDVRILTQLGGGLLLLSLAFLGARLYGRARQRDAFMPVVTAVLQPTQAERSAEAKVSTESE